MSHAGEALRNVVRIHHDYDHTLISWRRFGRLGADQAPSRGGAKMRDNEWSKALDVGRRVKFSYEELPNGGAFMTAQRVSASAASDVGQCASVPTSPERLW